MWLHSHYPLKFNSLDSGWPPHNTLTVKKLFLILSVAILIAVVTIRLVMFQGESVSVFNGRENEKASIIEYEPSLPAQAPDGSSQSPSDPAIDDLRPNPAMETVLPPLESRPVPLGVAGLLEALELAGADERSDQIIKIAGLWASKDPVGALAWAFSLEPGNDRVVASIALRDWSQTDPAGALKSIHALESGNLELAAYATQRLFKQWAIDDPETAWEAAGGIANLTRLGEIESEILVHWSESDPITTTAILNQKVQTGSDLTPLSAAFGAAANHYVLSDPTAAANWAKSLPEGEAKSSALSGLMNSWLAKDPLAASTWLRDLEPGDARDVGISTLVLNTRSSDPQSAFQWAGSISNQQHRIRLIQTAALTWLSQSPDVASAEIQRSGLLTQAEKESIFAIHREQTAP